MYQHDIGASIKCLFFCFPMPYASIFAHHCCYSSYQHWLTKYKHAACYSPRSSTYNSCTALSPHKKKQKKKPKNQKTKKHRTSPDMLLSFLSTCSTVNRRFSQSSTSAHCLCSTSVSVFLARIYLISTGLCLLPSAGAEGKCGGFMGSIAVAFYCRHALRLWQNWKTLQPVNRRLWFRHFFSCQWWLLLKFCCHTARPLHLRSVRVHNGHTLSSTGGPSDVQGSQFYFCLVTVFNVSSKWLAWRQDDLNSACCLNRLCTAWPAVIKAWIPWDSSATVVSSFVIWE